MRTTFIKTVIEAAEKDESIFFLTGDLGFGVVEPFRDKFPGRFLNVGVAEQNMVGIAAGLALSGKSPIVYSIATFAAFRPFEFIRNDVCYQNLKVLIVGVGAGFSYPQYAATHQAIDDVAVMSALPNLVILNPGDPIEAKLATLAALSYHGPVYLRIGKKGEPDIHESEPVFKIGHAITLQDGGDVVVIATGNILENASKAVQILRAKDLSVRFVSMPTLRPLDKEVVRKAARETRLIATVEEGCEFGGLGTAVAEVLSERTVPKMGLVKIALPQHYPSEIGSQTYMRSIYGLTPEAIAEKIYQNLTLPL
ncbi:MAG: transketolase [Parcubacteria group bacterium]|nr:transketolase [Parcubacteria group bacterium]